MRSLPMGPSPVAAWVVLKRRRSSPRYGHHAEALRRVARPRRPRELVPRETRPTAAPAPLAKRSPARFRDPCQLRGLPRPFRAMPLRPRRSRPSAFPRCLPASWSPVPAWPPKSTSCAGSSPRRRSDEVVCPRPTPSRPPSSGRGGVPYWDFSRRSRDDRGPLAFFFLRGGLAGQRPAMAAWGRARARVVADPASGPRCVGLAMDVNLRRPWVDFLRGMLSLFVLLGGGVSPRNPRVFLLMRARQDHPEVSSRIREFEWGGRGRRTGPTGPTAGEPLRWARVCRGQKLPNATQGGPCAAFPKTLPHLSGANDVVLNFVGWLREPQRRGCPGYQRRRPGFLRPVILQALFRSIAQGLSLISSGWIRRPRSVHRCPLTLLSTNFG